jgi:hypothetical protein
VQAEKLASENGAKIAQNVATGVIGVVIWPAWFAMDAKGAAGVEMDALKGAPAISRVTRRTALRIGTAATLSRGKEAMKSHRST